MSDRVNQIREAVDEYDETDSVAIIRDLHNPAYVDVLADAARDFAALLTRLEDGSLVLTELAVHYDSMRDRYVLVLPENYPQGPEWMEGGRINTGDLMTVVISKDGTGFDLAALGLQEEPS